MKKTSQRSLLFRQNVNRTEAEWVHFLDGYRKSLIEFDMKKFGDEDGGGMCAYARTSAAKEIIVGTEVGILHRLRTENPDKVFYPVDDNTLCPNMKKVTLKKVRDCLRDLSPRVTVPEEIALRAKRAIDAMLAV